MTSQLGVMTDQVTFVDGIACLWKVLVLYLRYGVRSYVFGAMKKSPLLLMMIIIMISGEVLEAGSVKRTDVQHRGADPGVGR